MNIVLVGADRFCNINVGNGNPIEVGGVLTVDDEAKANALLDDIVVDKNGNERPLFLPESEKEEIQYYLEGWGEEEPEPAAPKKAVRRKAPPRRARTAAKK